MAKISVKIKANAKKSHVVSEDPWLIELKSPPIQGKANHELIQVLAKYLGIPKSCVEITHGLSSRTKTVELHQSRLSKTGDIAKFSTK